MKECLKVQKKKQSNKSRSFNLLSLQNWMICPTHLFLAAGADKGRVRCFGRCSASAQSVLSAQPITVRGMLSQFGGSVFLLDLPFWDKMADLGLFISALLFVCVETA